MLKTNELLINTLFELCKILVYSNLLIQKEQPNHNSLNY